MFVVTKIKYIYIFTLLLIALVVYLFIAMPLQNTFKSDTNLNKNIIIDPGHGGADSGAMSKNGVLEKDLNLDMALKIGNLLTLYGYNVTYTRDSDIALNSTNKFNKREDILNRIDMVNSSKNAILISIHMNFFPQTQYSGAQIFYNNEKVVKMAEKIQTAIKKNIDANNNREIKKSPADVLLFQKSNKPSILCECGFLSNEQETAKLTSDIYRKSLAITIVSAIISTK